MGEPSTGAKFRDKPKALQYHDNVSLSRNLGRTLGAGLVHLVATRERAFEFAAN